jgi:superfamily II DNA or RNA helicase
MTLAEALARYVTERTRTKGNRYFLGGAVQAIDGSATHVTATVRGTVWYQVHLTRTGDEILASCGCPYFSDRLEFCKHIWAVILAADVQGYLAEAPITSRLYLESAYGDYDSDDDEGSTPGLAQGWADRTASRRTPDVRPRASWERALGAIHERAASLPSVPSERFRSGEIGYIIATDEAGPDLVPTLQVQWRMRRKNGEWGSPQPVAIAVSEIRQLPDLMDREILSLLLGATTLCPVGAYASSVSARASFRLMAPLVERVLPLVAQSGRLRLRAEAAPARGFARDQAERYRPAAGPPLAWDGGPAWSFRLDISEGDPIVVSGSFVRGEETVPIGAASAILAPGFVVMRGEVARADDRGALAWLLELRRSGSLRVPLSAAASLVETLARSAIDPAGLPEALRYDVVAVSPTPRVRITRGHSQARPRDELDAVVEFDYEGTIVPLEANSSGYDAAARRVIRRDGVTERTAVARLQQLGFRRPWYAAATGASLAVPVDRFPGAVRTLVEEGWHVEAEGRVIRAARSMHMQVRSGVDWFELHGQVDFGGQQPVPVAALLAALRRGEATVVLDDGTRGMVPEAWLRRYAQIAAFGEPDGDHVRYASAQTALLDALLEAQPSVTVDEVFARARAELATFQSVTPLDPPPGFRGRLREYQREALGWFAFLRRFGFGGCLADDMGLGKTVMVLALLEGRRTQREADAPRTSIAVVPRSLVFNWMEETARFTPGLRVLDYTGEGRGAVAVEEYDLLLTTYGTLRRDAVRLSSHVFDYVILDEAQAIKNPATASAKAARLLRGRHRLALSGTPVENHLGELWSLFEFLNPGFLGGNRRARDQESREGGQESRRSGGQQGDGLRAKPAGEPRRQERETEAAGWPLEPGSWKADGSGRKLDVAVAARALRPFILRRTKTQVAPELPDRIEQTIHCELEAPQRRFYDSLLAHYRETLLARVAAEGLNRSKMHVLEALLRLRQAASHPGLVDRARARESSAKFDVLLARLREVIDEGHKALVFSQFTSLLALLRTRLDAEAMRYEYLDGRTRDRAGRVAHFEGDASCPLFLISLKAGGVGLNLTAAGYVFLLDPWWNPAVEAQAIDRAHRIGQSKHVFAYRLIARDTIEEKIAVLQQSKRALAEAILTEDAGILQTLDPDELAWLLA